MSKKPSQDRSSQTIFDFKDYRKYLETRLSTSGQTRGLRSQIAEKLGTKPAFITQVLSGKNNLSPEHCPIFNEFLGHNEDESHYFILLVSYSRAGTHLLERYYASQIEDILEQRSNYLDRIKATETLSPNHQALYYSKWYYAAIHLLTSIPEFQTKAAIAGRIKLSLSHVSEAIDQLEEMGVIAQKNGRYTMTNTRVLLKKNSPWTAQMHTNYRLRAIESLQEPQKTDFHYSVGVSLTKKDFEILREKTLQWLEELDPLMRQSKEEEAYVFLVDLYKMI